MLAVGGAGGWYGRGVYDGSVVQAGTAAEQAQGSVESAVVADRAITSARTETETAVERVRYVTRTVEVAAQCPPGRGAVSADMAEQLRALADARQSAAGGAGRVP